MQIKILVIDDEEPICEILRYNLEKEGYDVDCAYSAEEALTFDLRGYSLMIVDIMMDRLSGFDFAKRLKNNSLTEHIPIIFCSALNGEDDTVMGLNIGGDDYITKPFVIGEVLARVRAVLRRSHAARNIAHVSTPDSTYEPDVSYKSLRVNRNEKTVYISGKEIDLTKTEFDMLLLLLTHRNRVFSREELIRKIWSDDITVGNRTIDANISRLRKKIGEYGKNITTRPGFGYGFKEEI